MTQPRCPRCFSTGAIGARYCACPAGAALRSRLDADRRANERDPRVRARDLRQEIQATPALTDPITEYRLLASLIAELHVLAMADEFEEQDFSDPRCRHVLRAIRQLRQVGADVGPDEIDHELRLQDMDRKQVGSGAIADKAGFWFVAELLVAFKPFRGTHFLVAFEPYRDQRELVEHDMAWLRELADRRRNLPRAP